MSWSTSALLLLVGMGAGPYGLNMLSASVLLLLDRSTDKSSAGRATIEDAKGAGAGGLFAGVPQRVSVKREALVAMYATGNDWKQVAAYKRQILDSVMDGEERFKVLNEIGEIWSDKDKNAKKAIEGLEIAKP